ncbi:hypothetical protein [Roseovarius sp. MMSF_3281]|uniref:hypothetical protein n=1 Tax=Roseovarius sp. MMSF_3281 TaxID=3046694 RepID=UPI00273F9D81|nr:hypothetical protein [Roseovarius sp. MMSF_3281]
MGPRDHEKEHVLWLDRFYGDPTARVCRNLADAAWHYAEALEGDNTLGAVVLRVERGDNLHVQKLVDVTDEANLTLARQRNRWPTDPSAQARLGFYEELRARGE